MAARWCGKKDWGEARPSPYWVESCPAVPCVALASVFRRRITGRERAPVDSVASRCTKQVCVLIVDVWYGWLDAGFKTWLSATYSWIRLLFVPARCTPVAQPMDRGVFAKIKGILRRLYGSWMVNLVQQQLAKGID
jgi:hypothetical protein